jgi:hypothetical protein
VFFPSSTSRTFGRYGARQLVVLMECGLMLNMVWNGVFFVMRVLVGFEIFVCTDTVFSGLLFNGK